MSKFTDAIDFVRHAFRAKDVRNAIADSMEEVWSHVTSEKEAAAKSASDALTYKNAANTSKTDAATSATNALRSEQNAATSATNALRSEQNAATSATNAGASSSNALKSEQNAAASAASAADSASKAASRAFNYVGFYATESALKTAYKTSSNGYWAIVGSTDSIWVWDGDTGTWKDSHDMSRLSDYMAEASFNPNGHSPEQVAFASDLEKLMPIGYMYQWSPVFDGDKLLGPDLSTAEKLADYLGFGTWNATAQNRVLMGASNEHRAGILVDAGLPDITGTLRVRSFVATSSTTRSSLFRIASGAFTTDTTPVDWKSYSVDGSTTQYGADRVGFAASCSNTIYGSSNTVQPSALYVYIYQRIA